MCLFFFAKIVKYTQPLAFSWKPNHTYIITTGPVFYIKIIIVQRCKDLKSTFRVQDFALTKRNLIGVTLNARKKSFLCLFN